VGGFTQDGSDADLYLLGLEGDDPVNLTEGLDLAVGWAEWPPDGNRIAFTGLEVDPTEDTVLERIEQVHVLDLATGQIRQLTTEGRNGFAVWEPGR
jgi:Tol biopolymer transport system component